MLAKIKDFVKDFYNKNFYDILIFIIIILLMLFSFAAGFITAKYFEKQPIIIENTK